MTCDINLSLTQETPINLTITNAVGGNKQDKDFDAVDGNLAIFASGQTVDAGYAAATSSISGSVVRRDDRQIINNIGNPYIIPSIGAAIEAQYETGIGIAGLSGSTAGIFGQSQNSFGGLTQTIFGTHHHQFGSVSAIATSGILQFIAAAATAAAARVAQLLELEQVVTANIATTYAIDGNAGTVFRLTATDDVVISVTNIAAGRALTVHVAQDGTGGHAITFSGISWSGGTAPSIASTGAGYRFTLWLSGYDGTVVDGGLVGEGWA